MDGNGIDGVILMKTITGKDLYVAVDVCDLLTDIHGNPPVQHTVLWESVSERIEEVRNYLNEWEIGDCLIVRLSFEGAEVERFPEPFVIRGESEKKPDLLLLFEE